MQESSSHSRCTVKRGGSGVASCPAESPGQPRPGALRALSIADGRWGGEHGGAGALRAGRGPGVCPASADYHIPRLSIKINRI